MSRQVSALEKWLRAPLFHRHARGLILTEQGDVLYRTVQEVMTKLDAVQTRLSDNREKPHGELRITTTLGIGTKLADAASRRVLELYPDVTLKLILSDEELDLGMREADVALRLREPSQPDLVRRRLFTVHYHLYASIDYLKQHGQPRTLEELDQHRILSYGVTGASFLHSLNSLLTAGRDSTRARDFPRCRSTTSPPCIKACLPASALPFSRIISSRKRVPLLRLLPQSQMPEYDCFLVYPEEMRNVARIQVFRDFLVTNAQRWNY